MKNTEVTLVPLTEEDREQFVLDNQWAFKYGAMIEFDDVVLAIDKETNHNHLDLLFVLPEEHGKGIGYGAWQAVEALYPETKVWETCTPYFEKRNIHFYVNKCGFHIVEFYNKFNPDPNMPLEDCDDFGPDEMFRFIKAMK